MKLGHPFNRVIIEEVLQLHYIQMADGQWRVHKSVHKGGRRGKYIYIYIPYHANLEGKGLVGKK